MADSRRDPYATACGVPGVEYCVTSPTLAPDALIAETGALLFAQGAHLERRDCPKPDPDSLLNLCLEVYSYRGVQVSILAGDEAIDQKVPTYLFGSVLTSDLLAEAAPVPLGSWEALGITPAEWGTPPCRASENGECVSYVGPVGGPGTAEDARRSLRAKLEQAGFRIDRDHCTTTSAGAVRCNVAAHRYRTHGGRDGMTVTAALKSADTATDGFTGFMGVTAENAKWSAPTSDPATAGDAVS